MGPLTPTLIAAALLALAPPAPPVPDAEVEARLRRDVTYMAAPELKGRGNGYPELEAVARRIETELKGLGIATQLQHFPFIAKVAREKQGATLTQGETTRTLVWGKDIEALGLSGDADLRSKPLAFLGYGVQIPGGYDDLAGIELQGRVAVIARSVPDLDAFAHLPRGERSLLARLKRLEMAKAAAVVILEEGGLRPLLREEGPVKMDLPVVGMTPEALAPACGDLLARLKTGG